MWVFCIVCFLWQVGEEGAGHFVKMVHNGIEYGDMQVMCEAYQVMRQALGMSNDEMSKVSNSDSIRLLHEQIGLCESS